MAHATLSTGFRSPGFDRPRPLSGDPDGWPPDARTAQREVLRQLDGWCRAHDWPTGLNAWIAEEAVRRS